MRATGLESLFSEARHAVVFSQPDLKCSVLDGQVVVEGDYHLLASIPEIAAQGPLATYNIKLVLDEKFPVIEPKLYEMGGAFPHDSDHHVNPDDTCCFGVWEFLVAENPRISVRQFLDGPIRSYFFSQHYHAETGDWPFGELSHGETGLLEACSRLLACPPDREIVEKLLRVLSRKWKRDRHPCPCGSRKRLRDCCRARLNAIPIKPRYREARRLLWRLQKYPKSNSAAVR